MSTLLNAVRCLECGAMLPADPFAIRCAACGSPWLDAVYDYTALPPYWPALVRQRATTLWRYTELLPFPATIQPLSLGEGWTPLTRAEGLERETGFCELWIKDERQQPTGSFKDRQASVAVTALRAQGIRELVLASTGNAAAAYAAYCARAGIKLWVFLTSSVPVEKMRELALYGAEVIKVTGTYDQAKELAADFAARHHLLMDGGAKAIPCKESMKTIAFEIAEQLGWQAPDWYIQAVSGGIGPLGVLKGFIELYQAGLTDRVPKLGIVQTEGCAPMVRAWEQGLERATPVQPDSLITVLATGNPGFSYTLLKRLVDQYGGAMVAVSDGDAFRTMRRIARLEGFSMEPAASVAFAGLDKLLGRGYLQPGERVVVNCSGHTFSAEKHALEDRYFVSLEAPAAPAGRRPPVEGLAAALEQLDEQITTLVVIDDNPHDNRLIRRLLQSYKNYRVLEAYTGQDGIDLVRQRRPGLVVLDLTLPDMDGMAVLSALKADERTRNIPVVVISAKTLTPEESAYLEHYTDSVWLKGNFSARELVSHVTELLGDDAGALQYLTAAPPVAEHPVAAFGQARNLHILVIEDNVWEARLMRRLLESRQRFEVMEAYSGQEALTLAARQPPHLILLTLPLPDMTAEQWLSQLQAQPQGAVIPLLILTHQELTAEVRARLGPQVQSVWDKETLDRSSLLAYVEHLLLE